MKCALCQNERFETVSEVDAKSPESLRVSLCKTCGLIQQNPIPTTDELKIYYSQNYRIDYKKTLSPKPKHVYRGAKAALQRIKFLHRSNIKKGTLLDIGAGGGEFTYLANKMGFDAEGIEPSLGYSEYAKREYDCNVITGGIEDAQGKYDLITMFHVLEHLPSPLKTFEKLYHLLNKDGILFVEVPWIETKDASPHNIYFKAHIFYFSSDVLVSCASRYFDVIKLDNTSNLKVIFRAKETPGPLRFPSDSSVENLRKRINQKGWFEYLFKGKGILKPFGKISRFIREKRIKQVSGRKIVDSLFEETEMPGYLKK